MLASPSDASDPFRGSIRSSFRSEGFRFCSEIRPRHFTGPQGACHPKELELSVVEHGTSTFLLDGHVKGRLGAGEFGIVPPMIAHSSWTHDAAVSEINLHFGTERLEETVASVGLSLRAAVDPDTWLRIESLPVTDGMKSVLNAIRFEASVSHRPCALTIDSLATALLSMVLRQAGARPIADDHAAPVRSGVRRAADRMRASPCQDHSLDELAATAGLSRFHFLRAFRKEHGLPPHGYLLSLRLEHAAELIRETELSLTTIAYEAGFGSSSRLTEAFQRRFGLAPSLWRKTGRADSSAPPAPLGASAISGSTRSNRAEVRTARLRHHALQA